MNEWELIARWECLYRKGLLFPLLHEPGYFYRFSNEFDPWGSKTKITFADLELAILSAEGAQENGGTNREAWKREPRTETKCPNGRLRTA